MLVVTGTARLAPGARDRMLPAAAAMVEATRGEEGCHSIQYAMDLTDPDLMVFHEVYTSKEALQAHLATDHMKAFYAVGGELMAGRPDVTMWVDAEEGQMGPG